MGSKINSVIVLMPNGRRQSLKVNLDSSVLQILEDVCSKHGYNSSEYSLRHHNTILDPASVVRFCSLPNNACIEMVQNKRPTVDASGKVLLSLQVDGESERLTGEFPCEANLESILLSMYPKIIENDANKVPVLVYMRREIIGFDSFKATTLRSLGLTSGRALLRLSMRDSEEHPELQFTGNAILSKPIKSPLNKEPEEPIGKIKQKLPVSSGLSERRPTFPSQPIPAAEIVTAVEIVDDVIVSAKTDKERQSPSPEMGQAKRKSNESRRESHKNKSPSPAPMDVDSQRTKSPKPDVNLDEIKYLDENNGLVFRLEESNKSSRFDVPDSFFDVTIDDVRLMMRDLKRNRESMENAPLQTEALRQSELQKKTSVYSKTVIRVQFPDRYVLQGVFNPDDTVADVCNFVKNYLRDPNSEFYLYTTPPKNVLSPSDTLLKVGCVPCAKIFFAYVNQNSEAGASKFFLHDKVFPLMTTQNVASVAACEIRGVVGRNVSRVSVEDNYNSDAVPGVSGVNKQKECSKRLETATATPSVPQPAASSATQLPDKEQSPRNSQQGKVPKWFKPV